MTDDKLKQIAQLDSLIVLGRSGAKPVWRGGAGMELNFPEGYRREVRENIVTVLENYYREFEPVMTHYMPNNVPRLAKLGGQFPTHFREVLEQLAEEDYFDGVLVSVATGETSDWPSQHVISVSGAWRNEPQKMSACDAYFLARWILDDPDRAVEFVLEQCRLLRPMFGLAGLMLVRNFSSSAYYSSDHSGFPFLKRFSGLDFMETGRFSLLTRRESEQRLRGVNWLTIVGGPLLDRLGPRSKLEKTATGLGLQIYDWGGGWLIRAGQYPALCDRNAGETAPLYEAVARLVAPIRFEAYTQGLFRVPPALDEVEETIQWVRRFG